MAKPMFTLKGEGKYVRVVTKDRVSGKFQLTLLVDSDAAQPVIDTIKGIAAEEHPKEFKAGKVSLNYDVEDDGRVAFKLRTGWKPTLTDAKGKKIKGDPKIGDGSTLKVKFSVQAAGFGDATKKRSVLLSPFTVMLVDLVPYSGGGWSNDDLEDGYESDGTEEDVDGTEEDQEEGETDEVDEPPPPPRARKKVDI